MRIEFKIGNIEVEGVSLGGVSVVTDMTLTEVRGMVRLQEECLENLPDYLDDLAKGFRKFKQLDEEFTAEDRKEEIYQRERVANSIIDFLNNSIGER